MQFFAASPYEKGNRSCVLEFLPYEKFLALWRGSLPADLVYELQFSFNFQLPVVKDRTRLRSESFGEVKCLSAHIGLPSRSFSKGLPSRSFSEGWWR